MSNKFNRPGASKASKPTDEEINRLINKGGDVPSAKKKKHGKFHINLGVPIDILEKIDECIENKRPRKSRSFWILEAMCDKLDREEKKGQTNPLP